jgi:hypothetical protein
MAQQSVPLDHALSSCIVFLISSTLVCLAILLLVISEVFCSVVESLAWEGACSYQTERRVLGINGLGHGTRT